MRFLTLLSPLSNFAQMISVYFAEIWDFLIFVGRVSAVLVVLTGAIIWLTEAHISRGRGLVFGGILLAIVIQYFAIYPPSFVTG